MWFSCASCRSLLFVSGCGSAGSQWEAPAPTTCGSLKSRCCAPLAFEGLNGSMYLLRSTVAHWGRFRCCPLTKRAMASVVTHVMALLYKQDDKMWQKCTTSVQHIVVPSVFFHSFADWPNIFQSLRANTRNLGSQAEFTPGGPWEQCHGVERAKSVTAYVWSSCSANRRSCLADWSSFVQLADWNLQLADFATGHQLIAYMLTQFDTWQPLEDLAVKTVKKE